MPLPEIFCASLSLALGTVLIAAGVAALRKSRASATWPTVEGSIVASGVEVEDEHYHSRVHYLYSFAGESFRGSRIRIIETWYGFKRGAKAAASPYKVGEQVLVWVNPVDPKEAVLQPGPQILAAVFAIAGGVFFFGMAALSFLDLFRAAG